MDARRIEIERFAPATSFDDMTAADGWSHTYWVKAEKPGATSAFSASDVGYAGGGGLAPLQVNAGRYNLALPDTAQNSNAAIYAGGGKLSLLNGFEVKSLSATLRRQFSSRVQAFVDLGVSGNTSLTNTAPTTFTPFTIARTAPNNPFNQDIVVTVPITSPASSTATPTASRSAPTPWPCTTTRTSSRPRAWTSPRSRTGSR